MLVRLQARGVQFIAGGDFASVSSSKHSGPEQVLVYCLGLMTNCSTTFDILNDAPPEPADNPPTSEDAG